MLSRFVIVKPITGEDNVITNVPNVVKEAAEKSKQNNNNNVDIMRILFDARNKFEKVRNGNLSISLLVSTI